MKLKISRSMLKEAVKKVLLQQYPRRDQRRIKKDLRFQRSLLSSQTGQDRKQTQQYIKYLQQQLRDSNKGPNEL